MIKCALLIMSAFVLATPAFALAPTNLADITQPGSVIVFPKFINMPPVQVDGATLPRTEIEIFAICPMVRLLSPDFMPGRRVCDFPQCQIHDPDHSLSLQPFRRGCRSSLCGAEGSLSLG